MHTKYVVILGSLMSGLGKGGITASVMKMLDFYGYKVLPIKFDGYLNYDCGTMNPYRHGEVFVLNDKSEVDMDFGIYERFINKDLTGNLSITGGKLYSNLIKKERNGEYLGEDVQVIPHVTNEIINHIRTISESEKPDVIVIEVGGTVGDIENSYFIEAMRQLAIKDKTVFINLTYVPTLEVVGEQKTKPAQIGFRTILQSGIMPSFVICRSKDKLLAKTKKKLALFTNLDESRIIDDEDQMTLYKLPISFMSQKMDKMLIKDLGLPERKINKQKLLIWKATVDKILNPKGSVNIAILGKYTNLQDSYASVKEALIHCGAKLNARVNISWIESEKLESGTDPSAVFADIDGVIVPGGFGNRGIEGIISGIKYCREQNIPYLGICLGMQLMVVEYARNVCGLKDANSSEFNKNSKNKVIDLMKSQLGRRVKGGTMRLGLEESKVADKKSIAYSSYGSLAIQERHRHRYEFNNRYMDLMKKNGLQFTSFSLDKIVETVEWPGYAGIGTQAHPELRSRIEKPAPLFEYLVSKALLRREKT